MNKINILFLSTLIVAGQSAYGMNAQNNAQGAAKKEGWGTKFANFFRGGLKDLRTGVQGTREDLREQADDVLPNRVIKNTKKEVKEEVKGFKKEVKGFKKDTDEIISDIFEASEVLGSLAGFKQSYNSYINTLDELKSAAKVLSEIKDLDEEDDVLEFDEADFQDLIDQEASVNKKQREKAQKQKPVYTTVRGKRVLKPQPAQQRVAAAVMPKHVSQLKNSVESFNRALHNQNQPQPKPQRNNVRGRRVAAPVINRRLSVADARKALNETIDKFKVALENERKQACKDSIFGEFIYGSSTVRNYAAMGAVALGALFMYDRLHDSQTSKTIQNALGSLWVTLSSSLITPILGKLFNPNLGV